MASTPRPSGRRPVRPVVGSRNPTGRPRTVAGRSQPPAETPVGQPVDQPVDQPSAPPPPVEEAAPSPEPPPPSPSDRVAEEPPTPSGPPSGLRTTLVLVIAIVIL